MRIIPLTTLLLSILCFFIVKVGASGDIGLDTDVGRASMQADFAITPADLGLIATFDASRSIYLLPAEPSISIVAKLVFVIKSSSKRLGLISFMVTHYSHHDAISFNMFKSLMDTFVTVVQLHKSINMVEKSDNSAYSPVLASIEELTSVAIAFLRTFTSSLLVPRLSAVPTYKSIILDLEMLSGLFYLLEHGGVKQSQAEILVESIFSAVDSVEDEAVVWSFYLNIVAPSLCIPLPTSYFITGRGTALLNSLSDDLIKIFQCEPTGDFDSLWLTQLGLLVRFRSISNEAALKVAEAISVHLISSSGKSGHLCNFMRLAFLDELARPTADKQALNISTFTFEPNTADFYIKLWNLIVPPSLIDKDQNENFVEFYFLVLQSLEIDYPGIIGELSTEHFLDSESRNHESLNFISKITNFTPDLNTLEGIEEAIEFVHNFIKTEIAKVNIADGRLRAGFILGKLLNLVQDIEESQVDDPGRLKILMNNICEVFLVMKNSFKFLPPVRSAIEVGLIVDFAFKLDHIEDAEMVIDFLFARIEKDEPMLTAFFAKYAENLAYRPDFFCLKIDRKLINNLNLQAISQFLRSATFLLTENGIAFYISAYLNGAMDRELVYGFLDRLQTSAHLITREDTWDSLVGAFAEVSYLEYKDDSIEYLNQKLADSQVYAVKLFEIFLTSEGVRDRVDIQTLILPWLCSKLASFESLKFNQNETNQLPASIKISKDISTNVQTCAHTLLTLLLKGASSKDLKTTLAFVTKLRESFAQKHQVNQTLAVSVSFCFFVLIIRTDESLISVKYARSLMTHYKLTSYKVSAPQIIFKSFKNYQTRSALLPTLFNMAFDRNDYGVLLDSDFFAGMPPVIKSTHLSVFFVSTFNTEGIDSLRLEILCHWMSDGEIVPAIMVQQIIEKVGGSRERPIILKLAVAIIRAVYGHEEYRGLRQLATRRLFLEIDHTFIFPRPLSMGILGGISDLINEPEFQEALTATSANAQDIRAMIDTENSRLARVTNRGALNLSDGVENVLQTYIEALTDLSRFKMTMNRKIIILDSIFQCLDRLTSTEGELDYIVFEYSAALLEDFVRIAVHLASQIYNDLTAPSFMIFLDEENINILFSAMVEYIRDSNVQALLVFQLFSAIKERTESRDAILDLLPRFANWRRFFLLPDTFRCIFNFAGPIDLFHSFMFSFIEAAFRFKDLGPYDAVDLSRDERQNLTVHNGYFSVMTHLINNYNLPTEFTLKFIELMNDNHERIEILSTNLVSFLRAAIRIRNVNPDTQVYRITTSSYGTECVYEDQKDLVQGVLKFLSKKPEFLTLGLVNLADSEVLQLMLELEIFGKDYSIFKCPQIQLIRSIFTFYPVKIDNLKQLFNQVELPDHTFRSLVMWFCTSFASTDFNEISIPTVMLVLGFFPTAFTLESFMDSIVSQSWLEASTPIIDWIKKICIDFPFIFANSIDETGLETFLNILLWNLEYDGKELKVISALLPFLDSLSHSTEQVKYRLIHLLASKYYRPLMIQLKKYLNLPFETTCFILRKLTYSNTNLEKEVEKIIWTFLDEPITANEEEIMNTRIEFIQYLNQLKQVTVNFDFSVVSWSCSSVCSRVSQLRSMHEIDLVLSFINQIGELARAVHPMPQTEYTEDLALHIAVYVVFLRQELLLQANSRIFVDLFKFLFKHSSTDKTPEYCEAVSLILPQIRFSVCIFASIIVDMRLEACMLTTKGLPEHFYEGRESVTFFLDSYMEKLHKMDRKRLDSDKKVVVDGMNFVFLFNCFHDLNAPDDRFKKWTNTVSRINNNDLQTEAFANNLKFHCLKRKHLVDDLIPIYINPSFVERTFNPTTSQNTKDNLISVFKLMLISNPTLYQSKVNQLPETLKALMSKNVDASYNEKRRNLIQDLITKCNLPSDSSSSNEIAADLDSKLEIVLKLDLSILFSEQQRILFHHLNNLIVLLSNSYGNAKVLAVALAILLKHQQETDPQLILKVLSRNSNVNEETINLLLKAAASLDLNFSADEASSIALFSLKSSNCTQLLFQLLNNQNLECHVVRMIRTILESNIRNEKLQIDLIVQNLISERINSRDSTFNELFSLARTHHLLPKTLLLSLERTSH